MKAQESTLANEYWEDRDWAWEHYAEFVKQYPDQWIAISNKQVVAHSDSIEDVEKQVKAKTGKDRFPVLFVEGRIHVY